MPDRTLPTVDRLSEAAARLADALAARGVSLAGAEVRLDLGAVEAVASRELGALITLNRRAREAGGRLALVGVRPPVAAVIRATRLDAILDVRPATA